MQEMELKGALIEGANSRDNSNRMAADETKRGLKIEKVKKRRRIACSTLLGSLMAAGLFFALAPVSARADDDKDIRDGRTDDDKRIRAIIAVLRAQVESLGATVSALESHVSTLQTDNTTQQNEINSLQTSNSKLQNQVKSLETSNTSLQTQLAAVRSNHALLLGPFVSVDPNTEIGVIGPNIIFSGANLHIVSGSGATNDNGNPTGLGNLIIGYDEKPPTNDGFPPFNPGDRGGSHNLVTGFGNRFTRAAFGGLVAGEANTISNQATSVSGGFSNTANGLDASVSGGQFNVASGDRSSVSGGHSNTASGDVASVSGGQVNTVSGAVASIAGGSGNFAGGIGTVVIGGQIVIDNTNNSIAPQPPFP
jgi:hypothetical protein